MMNYTDIYTRATQLIKETKIISYTTFLIYKYIDVLLYFLHSPSSWIVGSPMPNLPNVVPKALELTTFVRISASWSIDPTNGRLMIFPSSFLLWYVYHLDMFRSIMLNWIPWNADSCFVIIIKFTYCLLCKTKLIHEFESIGFLLSL